MCALSCRRQYIAVVMARFGVSILALSDPPTPPNASYFTSVYAHIQTFKIAY
jgi:hypothetical protein